VKGVLTRNPDWGPSLAGFQVECAWMVGAWDDVQTLVDQTDTQTAPIVMARLLLAMRNGDPSNIEKSASTARLVFGALITASGFKEYRRSYDAVLNLHLIHELEVIHNTISTLSSHSQGPDSREALADLSRALAARLNITLPTFRAREPILSMRRVAFALPLALFKRSHI
jgi:serine/threonine-protein kinase ATR